MSESHTLKYVHVDTLNRKSGDTKSRMTVQVPQGLENCSRVALKSFSIPNSFPNKIGKKTQWIETIQTVDGGNPIWKSALFTIMVMKSRCTNINSPCLSCDRDVIDEDNDVYNTPVEP